MAHILRVTDNTTTMTFTSGNLYLLDYVPQTSLEDDVPLRETVPVGFTGTISTIRSNIQTLNRLFRQAVNYARNGVGPIVYVEFDPGSSGSMYRSRLIDARPVYAEDLLGGQWAAANIELELEWDRQPFWEGPLTQIPLTNSSDTDNTAGITVGMDTENFVDIDGVNDMTGDMPSPIKVEMYNSYSTAAPTDEIRIWHNVYSNPATLTHILEGEDATGSGVTPTAESTEGASANNYAVIAWTTASEVKVATWSISSTQVDAMAGGRFGLLARWYGAFPYDDVYLRMTLEDSSGILEQGNLDLVPNTREMYLWESTRIHPALPGQSGMASISMCMYALRDTNTTHTINLDYIQLSPIADEGGWKRFKSASGRGVAYQEYFYHDATEREDYIVDSSSKKHPVFTITGGEILLVPGEDQRLYFNTCDDNGQALQEQTWTVKLWYRPRRQAL